MILFQAFGRTDTGCIREHSEDAYLIHPFDSPVSEKTSKLLAIVADGVGGHAGGQQASHTSVEKIRDFILADTNHEAGSTLVAAVEEAHRFLKTLSSENPDLSRMGTTCTALWANGLDAYVAQVGDSRAYLIRNDRPTQVTEDHTLVQKLLTEGKISIQNAADHPDKNVILQALGASESIDVDLFHVKIAPEDALLLCSDGLHGLVNRQEMVDIINRWDPDEALESLVSLAINRGGHDNITAVLVKVYEDIGPATKPVSAEEIGVSSKTGSTSTQTHPVLKKSSKLRYLLIILLILLTSIAGLIWFLYYSEKTIQPNQPAQTLDQDSIDSSNRTPTE